MIPHLTAGATRGAYYRATSEQPDIGIAAAPQVEAAGELQEIGVGMLGYAFMGKAHSNAFRKLAYLTWPPSLVPRLVAIAGRNEQAVAAAARRYGFERWTTDWREIVADERVGLFDNGGPNGLHAEPTIAAAEAGKHVLCEKPLGRTADEAYDIWARVASTGVKHLCGFNYRFVPAVRLARELIQRGELGELRHFRGRYLQDWGDDPSLDTWRFHPDEAGSGALGDLGTHVIDLARFLVGEIATVSGVVRTFVAGRQVDDALEVAIEFAGGTIGTIEATRLALGRRNAFQWEINGSEGSLYFDMERMNELQVFRNDGDRARGFRRVLVTEADHPFMQHWWPPGHILGWGDTFVHEVHHLLSAIATDGDVAPHGATFEDGYRASEIADAIVRSSEGGRRETVGFRTL
jgi:predicted dehydrogenase